MISGVTREIAGKSETFRMTTRAMMAIEDRTGKGLVEALQGFESNFRVSDLVAVLASCANDGAGVETERGAEIVDILGIGETAELIGEISEAAFPEAKAGKNAKRAARSK